MNYSVTTSIVCAALAGIVLLVVIVARFRQSILQRRGTPEAAEPTGVSQVPQEVVPAVIPAVVQAPQALAAAIPELNPDEALDDEPVTSQEIVTYLKELPPVQAEIEKDKFLGASVEWTLCFSSLMLKGSNQIEVTLLNADNAYPAVSFLVDMNQYPDIGKIKWGMPVTVRGAISSVYSMVIILTDVELSFPDSAWPDN